jgi:uncharacterized protein YkwD
MRTWFGLTFALALALFPATAEAAQGDAGAGQEPAVKDLAEAAPRLLELVNRERSGAGLAPLVLREDVTAVATRWSREMASQNRLSHNDSYFTQESIRRLGASLLGENVAVSMSLEKAHAALMDSPSHRANILHAEYRQLGIAVVRSVNGDLYVTEDFLAPAAPPSNPRSSASRLSSRPARKGLQAPRLRPAPSAASRPAATVPPSAAPAPASSPSPAVPAVLGTSEAEAPVVAPASLPLPPRPHPAPVERAERSSSASASSPRPGSLPSTRFPSWWPGLALLRRRRASSGC